MPQHSQGKYILVLDIGTTNSRCFLFDTKGNISRTITAKTDLRVIQPEELFDSLLRNIRQCLHGFNLSEIISLAITGQRATFLLWDRVTGESRTPFNLWTDTSSVKLDTDAFNSSWTKSIINWYGNIGHLVCRSQRTLALSKLTYRSEYVSVRLYSLLKQNPKLAQALHKKMLMFGCLDTWLLWKFTKGKVFATDCSFASCTALYDSFKNYWSPVLMWNFGFNSDFLPRVQPSSGFFGEVDESLFGCATPIHCIVGDQQAAMFGSGCFTPGSLKLTLGTGAFVDIQCGTNEPWVLENGFTPMVGWQLSTDNRTYYLAESFHPDFGNVIDWLIKVGYAKDYADLEEKLNSAKGQFESTSLLFYPYPNNLERTFENAWVNRDPQTTPLELLCSAMQGLAMVVRHIITPVFPWLTQAHSDRHESRGNNYQINAERVKSLPVNGNASKSKWLMQEISDQLQVPLQVCRFSEVTAFGAALLAGIGSGAFPNLDEVNGVIQRQMQNCDGSSDTSIIYPNKNRKVVLNQRFAYWLERLPQSSKRSQ